ncbi:MAG TPA: nucleotidyltransferase domain-containing protein [Gaiellaceae bacterium]|nr:nucleotidyltransferase domain-containing protein [Gaiellaceae bacterium]
MSRSEELLALAQRIAGSFPPDVLEVVVTGSVSRGLADELSDIEMLVVTEGSLSLDEVFELAREAGLEDRDTWGDPSTATRRVHGYLDGQSVETIWWSREFAEEHFDAPGSDQALLHGVALRTCGLLERWQERLAVYPDELAAERIEKAAERWGGFSPGGLLTIARPDTELARAEWLVESAQRVLAIVFALNRERQPTSKRLATNTAALAVKPERLAERIEEALAETDPHHSLLTMTGLQLDTVNLAPDGRNVVRARRWLADAMELLREATTR